MPCAVQIYRITDSDREGWGRGTLPSRNDDGPNPLWIRAVFSLLIMSKAQMGLMMCKVSGEEGRYERELD